MADPHGRASGRGRSGRALGQALVGVGVALLVSGGALYAATPPPVPEDAGSVPAADPNWPDPVPIYPTSRFGRERPAVARPGVDPAAVRLPGRPPAAVSPQAVGPRGELGLPQDVGAVGWWLGGARLDQPRGSLLLAGHVDGRGQGTGYFAALRELRVGDRVAVRGVDGRERAFAVTGRRSYHKTALPADVFAAQVPPRLVLVTCTGTYDERTRSYEDNLVVYAVPA
jgi:hypothetical protein